jgi:hypothetical protein
MVDRPRLLPYVSKEATGKAIEEDRIGPIQHSDCSKRVVAGHVFKNHSFVSGAIRRSANCPPSSLRPFWHRVYVKPGRVSHSLSNIKRFRVPSSIANPQTMSD